MNCINIYTRTLYLQTTYLIFEKRVKKTQQQLPTITPEKKKENKSVRYIDISNDSDSNRGSPIRKRNIVNLRNSSGNNNVMRDGKISM